MMMQGSHHKKAFLRSFGGSPAKPLQHSLTMQDVPTSLQRNWFLHQYPTDLCIKDASVYRSTSMVPKVSTIGRFHQPNTHCPRLPKERGGRRGRCGQLPPPQGEGGRRGRCGQLPLVPGEQTQLTEQHTAVVEGRCVGKVAWCSSPLTPHPTPGGHISQGGRKSVRGAGVHHGASSSHTHNLKKTNIFMQ